MGIPFSIIPALLLFSCLLAMGQILFKKAALDMGMATQGQPGFSDQLLIYVTNPWLMTAILLYAGLTILWVEILKIVPLSRAYPFVALGFILTPLAAHFLFAEILGLRYWVGATFILSGVIIITMTPSP